MDIRDKNFERCRKCKYRCRGGCSLMFELYTEHINKCILEFDEIKDLKEDSCEKFLLYNQPKILLQFLGKQRADIFPKPGQKVLTLTGGFRSSNPGKIIIVEKLENNMIYLKDINGDGEYGVVLYDDIDGGWYNRIFVLENWDEEEENND